LKSLILPFPDLTFPRFES